MNTNLFPEAHSLQFSHTDFNTVHGNQTITHNYKAPSAAESGLLRLYEVISEVGALHDDDARFPPPKCHPDTRKAILDKLTIWAGPSSASDQSVWNKLRLARAATSFLRSSNTICWLYGPAGVGKSAIAQTLCERLHGENLAASFFFSRNSPTRDNPKYLFLTIAYCLATYSNDSKLRSAIDKAVKRRPGVLKSSIVTQFQELIVDPLRSLSWWRKPGLSRLVVIDGLDECKGADAQRLVLETITGSVGGIIASIPLRFLITSRPEHVIREAFNRPPLLSCATRTVLDDSADTVRDIELYLRDGFRDIRGANSDILFPSEWPEAGVLDELVMRASGQFIYASTVLKYVGDRNSYPPDRLQTVFNFPIGDAGAFADLDILYHEILASNSQEGSVVQVLALILLTRRKSQLGILEILEQVYSLPKATIALTLRGLHSVLNVSSDSVTIYHKSFVDFLLDKRRSREYFIDLDVHRGLFLDHLGEFFARQDAESQSTSPDRATIIDRVNRWDRLVDTPDDCFRVLLERNPQEGLVVQVLAFILLTRSKSNLEILVKVFSLPKEAIALTLQGLHSVLNVSFDSVTQIRHKSFVDFLLDKHRSKEYFIDLDAHRGLLLDHLGKILTQQDAASQSTSLDRATMIDRVNQWDSYVDAPDDCFRVLLERFDTMKSLPVLGTFLCLRSIARKGAISISLLEDLLSGSGAVSEILQSLKCVLESRPRSTSVDFRLSSFKDFLLDSKRSHKFFIHLPSFHARLASYCLKAVHNITSREERPDFNRLKMNPSQVYAMDHVLKHLRRATMAKDLIYQAETFDVIKYLNWKLPKVTVLDPWPDLMHAERQLSAWAKALNGNIYSLRLTSLEVKKLGDIRLGTHRNTDVLLENITDGIYIASISDVDALLDLERLLTYQHYIDYRGYLSAVWLFNRKELERLIGVVSNIVLIHPDEIVMTKLDDFRDRSTTIPQMQPHFIDFRRGNASWAVFCMETIMTIKSPDPISDYYAITNCFLHLIAASKTGELISKLNELLVFLQRREECNLACIDLKYPSHTLAQRLIDWLKGFPEAFQSEVVRANSLLQKLFPLSFGLKGDSSLRTA